MAYTGKYVGKYVPYDGASHIFELKEQLKLAGWTVLRSSDGSTVNDAGDQITHADNGAGGMDNSRAWFVIRQPGGGTAPYSGGRQFVFQRGTDSTDLGYRWMIGYSYSNGYGAGTGTATQTPTHPADHQFLIGSGTAASPVFVNFFQNSTNGSDTIIAIGDDTENFGWYLLNAYTDSTYQDVNTFLFFDPMVSGTYESADDDPFVMAAQRFPLTTAALTAYTNGASCWFDRGGSNSSFVPVAMQALTYIPHTMPLTTAEKKVLIAPVWYGRDTTQVAPNGNKGMSTLWRWMGSQRTIFQALSESEPGAYDTISCNTLCGRWIGIRIR